MKRNVLCFYENKTYVRMRGRSLHLSSVSRYFYELLGTITRGIARERTFLFDGSSDLCITYKFRP